MTREFGFGQETRLTSPVALHSIRALPWGAVAQLGERDVRNVEVSGSIPLGSTKSLK